MKEPSDPHLGISPASSAGESKGSRLRSRPLDYLEQTP